MKTPPALRWGCCVLLLVVGLGASGPARADTGAQVQLGFETSVGVAAYQPAPQRGLRVEFPSPTLSVGGLAGGILEVRTRWNAVQMLFAAIERDLFELHLDSALLPTLPVPGNHVSFVGGPLLGVRLVAGSGLFQPGLVLGARLGFEWRDPETSVRFGLSAEPFFEARGGLDGAGGQSQSYGGGGRLVLSLLAPRPEPLPSSGASR